MIGKLKTMCLEAALKVAGGRNGFGIFCDGKFGRDALYNATGSGLWIGRSSTELQMGAPGCPENDSDLDCGILNEWPLEHVVRFRWSLDSKGDAVTWGESGRQLARVFAAARRNRLEFMLELDDSESSVASEVALVRAIRRCYDSGIRPDWWLLPPLGSGRSWSNVCDLIEQSDPYVRGIVVSGGDMSPNDSAPGLAEAAGHSLVKGFATGEQAFSGTLRSWLNGDMDEGDAISEMTQTFGNLCRNWDTVRNLSQEKAA